MSEIRLGNYHNMRIGIYADIPEGKYGGIQQYIEKLTLALI
jgi:hypothetical protein